MGDIMNKRGYIIQKEKTIPFDETVGHILNLENIIRDNYPELEEYIALTTNVGLCIAITNADDIVIKTAYYDGKYQSFAIYLPEDLNELTTYQNETLLEFLPSMEGIVEAVSYKKMTSLDGEDIPYTQEELTQVLTENLKNKNHQKCRK